MKALIKDRKFLIFAAVYFISSVIILTQPLFNYLGFEFSAVMGLITFFISSHITYKIYSANKSDKKYGFPVILFQSLKYNLPLMVIPFLTATINMLFVKNCSYFTGVVYYLLIPCITVIYSVSLSLLIFTFFNRHKRTIFFSVFVVIALYSLSEFFFNPQLFVYNHLIGYLPGVIYDEELYITSSLFFYRLLTILHSVIFLIMANVFFQLPDNLSLKSKIKKLKYALNPLFIITLSAICVIYFFRNELRIESEKGFIKSSLGSIYTTEHFNIYYSGISINNERIQELAKLHEFYYYKICKELNVKYEKKIESFIYPSADVKFNLIGAKYTLIAKPWLSQIHLNESSIEEVLKHELVHVIAGDFGLPVVKVGRSAALVEGLAMAIEWQWGYRTPDTYSANIINFLPNVNFEKIITTTGFLSSNPNLSYVLCGSFIRYILDNYGAEKVKELYYNGDYEKVTGKSEAQLIKEWKTYLLKFHLEKTDSSLTVFTFKRPAIFQKVCARVIANLNEEAFNSMRGGNYYRSIELFNQSISLSNNNDAKTGLIMSYLRSGNYNAVLEYTGNLFDTEQNTAYFLPMKLYRADALWQKAFSENNERLYDSAFKECSAVFFNHLNESYDFSSKARMVILSNKKLREEMVDYFSGSKDESLKLLLLSEIVSKNSDFYVGKLMIAKQLFNKKDYYKTLSYLNSINDFSLSNFFLAEKYKLSGLCYMKVKAYDKADNAFKHTIGYQTNDAVINEVKELREFIRFIRN